MGKDYSTSGTQVGIESFIGLIKRQQKQQRATGG